MTTNWWQHKTEKELRELERERETQRILEAQERVREMAKQPNPLETWAGFGRGVSWGLHAMPESKWQTPYEELPEASIDLPWRSPFTGEKAKLGTKGAAEFIPDILAFGGISGGGLSWMKALKPAGESLAERAILRAGQVAVSPLAGIEKGVGLVGKGVQRAVSRPTSKVARRVTRQLAEAGNPELPEPLSAKMSGALNYALRTQKETRALAKEQLSTKAATLEEIFAEGKGVQTYNKAMSSLKGKLEKGNFEVPAEFQFTEAEGNALLNTIFEQPIGSFEKRNASEAILKLAGLIRNKETGLPEQLVKSEIELLEAVFPSLRPIIQANKTLGVKAWETFIDAANLPRALLASGDLSVTFRQCALAIARRPHLFPGTMNAQIKTIFSSKNWKVINDVLVKDADVQLFAEKGMFLAPEPGKVGIKLWAREEEFMSHLAERIPGIGQFVKASERAFTGGANYVRGMLARDYAKMLRKMDALTDENIEGLAHVINWSTGRGSFPKKALDVAPIANALMFSPRYVFSRIYDTPKLLFSPNAIVRREAIRTFVQFMGLGSSVLGLSSMAGAKVEMNPLSSDFGKIKVGDTRLDIWAGYVQYARFVAQILANERKIVGSGRKQELNRLETTWRMLQSKGSPIASIFVDLLAGETYTGEPMFEGGMETATRELQNRLTPLWVQDFLEAIEANGLIGGLVAPPAILGIGATSYKPRYSRILPSRPLPKRR